MGQDYPLNGEFLMGHEDSIFMAHEIYFVPGPLAFSIEFK